MLNTPLYFCAKSVAETERVAGPSAIQGTDSNSVREDATWHKAGKGLQEKRRKAEGCEVSFSSSSSRLFQLQQLCLIEGTGTAGLPHGERDRRSTIKWLFQKKKKTPSSHITANYFLSCGAGLEEGGKNGIINKRNQRLFLVNCVRQPATIRTVQPEVLRWGRGGRSNKRRI